MQLTSDTLQQKAQLYAGWVSALQTYNGIIAASYASANMTTFRVQTNLNEQCTVTMSLTKHWKITHEVLSVKQTEVIDVQVTVHLLHHYHASCVWCTVVRTSELEWKIRDFDSSSFKLWDTTTTTTTVYGLFPGPCGWASARRKLLLDFMVLERIKRGRYTDNLGGCHFIRTNQQFTSINPRHFYIRCPSCHNPSNLSWLGTGTGICWIAYPMA